ncbi:aminoacetone oxidase family FAD-binding enzyme [bacterium]|nr:aminoacetone oxidase family FAD-binding enzyme [bacterium]
MERDFKTVAIIGAGASGCICAYHLLNKGYNVTLFDKASPLRTLLPTGGGRCNLAHSEYDFKELAGNYPRGEKFLYSIFSKFSTSDTLEMFENMGISTYCQENGRIFPVSNSAKKVREIILDKIKQSKIIKEEVLEIKVLENGFKIKSSKSEYYFTHLILAIGGHSNYEFIKDLGLDIVDLKPSLVGLNTFEKLEALSGTAVKNAVCNGVKDDLLFTHFGVSGPLIYTISSLKAFDKTPYKLNIDLAPQLINLQEDLNSYPHKEIKKILCKYLPQKVVNFVLDGIEQTTKAHSINGKTRDLISDRIHNFEVTITGVNKGEETVSAGGIDLNQIDSKTMGVKNIPNLYCIGEILNIDGFCGGFNLQNAWSTAFVCADSFD